MPSHFQRRTLLALISAAFATDAGAVAGWVEFTIGGATVSGASGLQRPAAKGVDLDSGDTVRTANDGRVQIRFTDGAYVSLQPNTEFAIKDYNFQGKADGNERGFFALARGAMRTVTGAIGRLNRNRYQLSTPTATIGIRGTGGRIEILTDGSTLVAGTSGIWTLTNPSGTIDVPAGTFARAPSVPNQPPQRSTQGPSAGPAPVPTPLPPEPKGIDKQIDTTCQTNPTGAACIGSITTSTTNPNPPLTTGSGYHVSYAYGSSSGGPPSGINSSITLANATFNGTGQMTQFTATNSATFTGAHQEFGTVGGAVAWGRWTGPVSGTDGTALSITPGTNEGYHYVVGLPATGMPTAGSASFTFVGATMPTGQNGALTPGTFSGTLTVNNWATGSMTVGVTVSFTAPTSFSYSFSTGASFSGSPAFSGSTSPTAIANNVSAPLGYQCTLGCQGKVNGAFFGAGAAFAGFAYQITGISNQAISGAAVFKQ
jgi:FecR protein